MTSEKSINDIEESDWVGIRLLKVIMGLDPSAVRTQEVDRCLMYYRKKYSARVLMGAIDKLVFDPSASEFFSAPDCSTARRFRKESIDG
jgi:hypothetical protein